MTTESRILRWEVEKIEFGQIIWTVEAEDGGFIVRELTAVMIDERHVVASRQTYSDKQSLVSLPYKRVYIDKNVAERDAKHEQRWYLQKLEHQLANAKRYWNSYHANVDEKLDVEQEDWD